MTRSIAVFWVLVLLSLSPAQAQRSNVSPVSAEESAAVDVALRLGQDIFRYDRAAWFATDAMLENVSNAVKGEIRGWIVTEELGGLRVTFWKKEGDGYAGAYSAKFDGKTIVGRHIYGPESDALSAEQIKLICAGQTPNPRELPRCTNLPMNSVILPSGKPSGSVYVYYLTAQRSALSIPMGGHHRYEVLDGQVISDRKFTNSCLELPIQGTETKKKPEALVLSHVLDPVPTEIHVFAMFASGLPVYAVISEPDRMWKIERVGGWPRAEPVEF